MKTQFKIQNSKFKIASSGWPVLALARWLFIFNFTFLIFNCPAQPTSSIPAGISHYVTLRTNSYALIGRGTNIFWANLALARAAGIIAPTNTGSANQVPVWTSASSQKWADQSGTNGSGGGSATNLTPWPTNIDAAGYSLSNVLRLEASAAFFPTVAASVVAIGQTATELGVTNTSGTYSYGLPSIWWRSQTLANANWLVMPNQTAVGDYTGGANEWILINPETGVSLSFDPNGILHVPILSLNGVTITNWSQTGGGPTNGITATFATNLVNSSSGVIQTNATNLTFKFSPEGTNVIQAIAATTGGTATNAVAPLNGSATNLTLYGGLRQNGIQINKITAISSTNYLANTNDSVIIVTLLNDNEDGVVMLTNAYPVGSKVTVINGRCAEANFQGGVCVEPGSYISVVPDPGEFFYFNVNLTNGAAVTLQKGADMWYTVAQYPNPAVAAAGTGGTNLNFSIVTNAMLDSATGQRWTNTFPHGLLIAGAVDDLTQVRIHINGISYSTYSVIGDAGTGNKGSWPPVMLGIGDVLAVTNYVGSSNCDIVGYKLSVIP